MYRYFQGIVLRTYIVIYKELFLRLISLYTRNSPKDLATLQCIVIYKEYPYGSDYFIMYRYVQALVLRTWILYNVLLFSRNCPKDLYRYLQGIVLRTWLLYNVSLFTRNSPQDLATL